ncbi:MAG TPA: Spx/MgsR family RNA polymerase-binding regulatory protein [Opitutaceae bacterium]|nr:Spx/MgsR family RNA polymerase-binding regulatory protein [Opitutaceae bacterium]
MLTVYTYAQCSTCRNAVKWLTARGLKFEIRPIRETPPGARELSAMLAAHGGNLRRLFNTSSQDYRDLGISERIEAMAPAEAFGFMAKNGNLVRRPFLLGPGVALVGFDEEAWAAALK